MDSPFIYNDIWKCTIFLEPPCTLERNRPTLTKSVGRKFYKYYKKKILEQSGISICDQTARWITRTELSGTRLSRTGTLNISSAMLRSRSMTRSRPRSAIAWSVGVPTVRASDVQYLIAGWGCAEDTRIRGNVGYGHGFDLAVQRVSAKSTVQSIQPNMPNISPNRICTNRRKKCEIWRNLGNFAVRKMHQKNLS